MYVFRSCLLGLMEDEQRHVREGRDDNTHLVARLVRAREEDQLDEDDISVAVNGLKTEKMNINEQEIISNYFVYAFTENDTTAIA
jgi:hypothetical protein